MRTYSIMTRKVDGEAPLYTKVKRTGFKDIILNCLVMVNIQQWRKAMNVDRYMRTTHDESFSKAINRIDEAIKRIQKDQSITDDEQLKETLRNAVDEIMYGEKRRLVEEEKAKKESEKARIEEGRKNNIHFYVSNLIRGMKDGAVRKVSRGKGNVYSDSSLNLFDAFLKLYDGFDSLHIYRFSDIDGAFYNRWESYMRSKGFMQMSINAFNSLFRRFINRAKKDGVLITGDADLFTETRAKDTEERTQVYLTKEEVDALYNMELTGVKCIIRDIFLVGCFTCQRVSDYARITKDNFTVTPKGTKIIKLTQKKTGKKVCVPLLDSRLETILEKYGYNLPTRQQSQIGSYIKDILKELSESVKSLAMPVKTLLHKKTSVMKGISCNKQTEMPKWSLVSTHTARRTGITILYQSHKFDYRQLMSISGHAEISTFKRYIRLTEEETADEIAEIASNENLF